MPLRPVRIYGDPVLRQKAREIREFDDSLRALVTDLFETMQAYQGVGLAANQVGVAQRVFVVDVPLEVSTLSPFFRDSICFCSFLRSALCGRMTMK